MTSTFSPLKPLVETTAKPDAEQLANEVQTLEANMANLTRQLAEFSLRIQELETDHIVAAKKHEDSKAEDRAKMVKLATALRAERDARLCKGCHRNSKNAVAVPCLHMSHCGSCIENLENCPVCNAHLKGFISANLEEVSLENSTPR
jgi:rubrerythrin